MNEKITEKYIRAVEISMYMWEWLKDNPGSEKWDWPLFSEYNIAGMEGYCPLCQYHKAEFKNCILREGCGGACCDDYSEWIFRGENKYAERIHNKIKKEYDRITV